jgi:hypothetical protein
MVGLRKASAVLVGIPVAALVLGMMPVGAAPTVTSADIVDNTIQAVDIAPNAVGASETASNSVGLSEIVTNGVGAAETAPNSVTASKIAAGAVGTSEVADESLNTDDIEDGSIFENDFAPDILFNTEGGPYGAASSLQMLSGDLTLASGAGKDASSGTAFLAGGMGNVFGSNLTKTGNYIGGVIGHYSVTGTNASTYPVGAVLGGISDGTTTADGAFVAYTDGDSALTTAGAAFKVMNNNSTAGSGFDYGVDLQDAAHDGYQPVDEDFYNKAPLRLVRNVVVLVNDAAPVDGTSGTGAGTAGPGSMYVDTAGADLYINAGTLASPAWKLVTRAP